MSTDRLDAQVEVKVPAQNGRKAYSYFRNVSAAKKGAAGVGGALALGGLAAAAIALRKTPEESKAIPAPVPVSVPIQPTSSVGSAAKKVAISGAGIAATGLVAKTIAKKAVQDRKKKKEAEEEMAREAGRKELEKSLSELSAEIDKTFSKGEAPPSSTSVFAEPTSKGGDLALDLPIMVGESKPQPSVKTAQSVSGRQMSKQVSQQVAKTLLPNEKSALKIRQLGNTIYGSLGEGPDRLPSPKPKLEVGGALVPVNKPQPATPPIPSKLPYTPPAPKVTAGALTVAPSESGKASGSAIAEPNKTLLTKVAGSAGAAAGKLYRKTKEGLERDRVAREKLASRTVDLNDMARKAGAATRSTINAVDNFARSFMQTFVDRNNTIDVSASEVKTTQREIPKRTRRANKTMNRVWNNMSRRYESFDERIDSFIATRLIGES